MKKKNLLFVAATMVMAGCASDDMIGDNGATQSDNQVIGFNMSTPAMTRGTALANAEDAGKLGQEFIVWGEKNEPADGSACAATDLVFENYRVQYADADGSTKNSTVSNTTGWDYVGITPYDDGTTVKVSPSILTNNTSAKQTIKYWDFGKNYTFTAVSAYKDDISTGKVTITKTQASTATSPATTSPKDKGYTIVLKNGADASKIFVADRKENVNCANSSSVAAVQMQFRNFQTKIRFGFYETVPGYNVQITNIGYNNTNYKTSNKFGVNGKFITSPTANGESVTYTVTYDDTNKPIVDVAESANTTTTSEGYCDKFGTNIFQTGKNYLGKSSLNSEVTYDKTSGAYTEILPNTGNSTPMTFTVSYKLISEDTEEEIAITDRQVTVPAQYCQWKPNFAYTYLFKVSDQSAELYPITFDAVVEADEVSKQETITEVASDETNKVCITTIGFNGNTVVESTTANEYASGNTIYASVMEGSNTTATTLTTTNIALYTVTGTQAITEASVANCVKNGTTPTSPAGSKAKTVTDLNGNTMTATPVDINTDGSTIPCIVKAVPREDGNGNRDIYALKWTGAANTTYAVEYTKTTTTTPAGESQSVTKTYKYYKIVIVK